MGTLVIAIGNQLRGDDGVAHEVLKHIDSDSRSYLEFTPEISEEIAGYDTVIFVDADCRVAELCLDPVPDAVAHAALTHACDAAAVVSLSRVLFGFSGKAFLCRIPAADFGFREGLTDGARKLALTAASRLHF